MKKFLTPSLLLASLLITAPALAGTAYGRGRSAQSIDSACSIAADRAMTSAHQMSCNPGEKLSVGGADVFATDFDGDFFYCQARVRYACRR